MLYELSQWVDENPEYVLIASSDHGGQLYYGQDYYCCHGCNYEGNQGILYIYMSNFNSSKHNNSTNTNHLYYEPFSTPDNNININSYDVSLIISQVLENVNIPLKNTGSNIPLLKNSIYIYSILKRPNN
jgi:hypothetical protein